MAQRDYVKKKSKNTKKNSSRIIPNLMMVIAMILVVLFIAILYFISTNKTAKPTASPQNITPKPAHTLPEKPEERWTYLKQLENPDGNEPAQTTPDVDQSAQQNERQEALNNFVNDKPNINQPVKSSSSSQQEGDWFLQCGAFKNKSNAETLRAKIAMSGVDGFIKNDKFYRVLAGPYSSKEKAEIAINSLKNNEISSCITIQK